MVYIVFTLLNSNFLSWTNFVNILVASHLVGLVAIGHTYLIIAGQNDLSPGSVAAFSGVLAALLVNGRLDTSRLLTHRFQGFEHLEEALLLRKDKPKDLIKPVVIL